MLKTNRLIVQDEWQARALFNCVNICKIVCILYHQSIQNLKKGYFGKYEYTRGKLECEADADDSSENEYSINEKDVINLSNQRYNPVKNSIIIYNTV